MATFLSKYSVACIQRPLKGSNESGLLMQIVSNTGLTVVQKLIVIAHEFFQNHLLQKNFRV